MKKFGQTKNFSEDVAAKIDEEISKIIKGCYDNCISLLKENDEKLCAIAQLLIKQEKIDGEEFEALFKDAEETVATVVEDINE